MNQSNTLTHLNVYTVEEYDAQDANGKPTKARSWTKIGAAFPHKEGPGFNIELKAFPRDGRLVVLPPQEDRDAPAQRATGSRR